MWYFYVVKVDEWFKKKKGTHSSCETRHMKKNKGKVMFCNNESMLFRNIRVKWYKINYSLFFKYICKQLTIAYHLKSLEYI